MADLATAYVQIVPTAKGIKASLSKLMDQDAEEAGKQAGGAFGNGLKAVGQAGIVALTASTAAITAFGKSAVDAGMSFDASMSQVAATMGKTVDEVQELRDFALEMGSKTAFSASQAADALNYMALAGYDATTSMEMLPNVLNLAAAGGIDLASASDMVTDAQSALGLSLEETSAMVDQMAKASSKSNTSVAQLGEAFLTIGATARNLRGGTQELSTVLGVLADNGIKGAEGGTHLRNMILSLQNPTDVGAKALQDLGIAVYEADGNMRSMIDIIGDLQAGMADMDQETKDLNIGKLFNKTDLAAVNALLGTSSDRYSELGQAIEGAWYSNESLSKSLESAGFDIEDMKNKMGKLGIDAELFTYALDSCGGDAEMFADLLWEISDSGVKFEDITTAMGGDLDALGIAFSGVSGAAQTMADTQLDNLAGDITLFKSAMEGAQITVSDMLTPAIRDFVQFASAGIGEVTTALQEDGLEGAMAAAGEWISGLTEKIIGYMPMIVSSAISLVSAFGGGLIDNLPVILETGIQIITNLITGITEAIPELIPSAINAVITITNGLMDNLPMLIDAGLQLLDALANGIIDNIDLIIEAATTIIEKMLYAIATKLPEIVAGGIEIIVKLVAGLIGAIPKLIEAAGRIIGSVIAGFMSVDWMEIGSNMIAGIIDGIKGMASKLWESATGVVESAVSGIKDLLGIHSPSAVFRDEVGKMLDLGLAEGLEQNTDPITKAMEEIAGITEEPLTTKVISNYQWTPMEQRSENNHDGKYEMYEERLEELENRKETIIIPVYVGNREIRREVIDAEKLRDLRNGGH